MAITPTGAPIWQRTNDYTTYGGNENKVNYQSQGAINARTDVDATEFARLTDDVASMARTSEFATFVVTCNDTSPDDPTISDYDAHAGSAPTGTRNGDGDIDLVWSASYSDAYGVSADIHIVGAEITVQGTTAAVGNFVVSDPDANGLNEKLQLNFFTASSGAALSDAVATVTIKVAPP